MQLVPKIDSRIRWPEDVARIVHVMADRGYAVTPAHAQRIYEAWSEEEYCAGWLGLTPDDEKLAAIILSYATKVTE